MMLSVNNKLSRNNHHRNQYSQNGDESDEMKNKQTKHDTQHSFRSTRSSFNKEIELKLNFTEPKKQPTQEEAELTAQ